MKRTFTAAIAALVLISFTAAQAERILVIPSEEKKPAPLFFSTDAEVSVRLGMERSEGTFSLVVKIHQGRPATLSVGLTGEGDVVAVSGDGLRSWAVRREEGGMRFLDLQPALPEDMDTEIPREFRFSVTTRGTHSGGEFQVLLPAPGAAAGFASAITLTGEPGAIPRVLDAEGLHALAPVADAIRFSTSGVAKLKVRVEPESSMPRPVELFDVSLSGAARNHGDSLLFSVSGNLVVTRAGSAMELLEGAAPSGAVSGEGWYVRLAKRDDRYVHELVGEREGSFPFRLDFNVPVTRDGDWRNVSFRLSPGVVVPLVLLGIGENVTFSPAHPVLPELRSGVWNGFLPAEGRASFAWKEARGEEGGTLFFTSEEAAELKVGAGLARRVSEIGFRVLQGRIDDLSLEIAGDGEILAVTGPQVLSWGVTETDGSRLLDVKLSRPIKSEGSIRIDAQTSMGAFPVSLGALRFSPRGALRHSGSLKLVNVGAVKLQVVDPVGLIQLSAQRESAEGGEVKPDGLVFRFPSADHDYRISADQVMPEVAVNEVTVHELADSDRRMHVDLELDIREAPLREWITSIPADFTVAEVAGAEVADFTVGGSAGNGSKELKILFGGPVEGRQLVTLKLEKNLAAAAGDWTLPVLRHPSAKSARGFVGVLAGAGYRILPGDSDGLAEVPPDYFPKRSESLQQAWRIRDPEWNATVKIETLGRSVQADVFHLYSLKEGAVSGSVLVNYFVVGAPASEWRLEVPESLGNVEVTGQNTGRDWRREGNVLVVPLTRPVLGAATLLVTFERPMGGRGGEISPGEVRPLDVQSERGHVQVVSPLQVKYDEKRSEGPLMEIDVSELPVEYRLFSSAPTIGAWRYSGTGMSLVLGVEWFARGEVLGQFVDFAELESHISRDGQIVTDARFFVKTRGLPAFRVRLPDGAVLWHASVDGAEAVARADGADTLVPLPSKPDPDDPVEVSVRYGVDGSGSPVAHLAAPSISAPLVIGAWRVTGDDGRRLLPRRGNVRPSRPAVTEDGYEWISTRARIPAGLVLLGASLGLALRRFACLRAVAALCILMSAVGALVLARNAAVERSHPSDVLEFVIPAVMPNGGIVAEIANVAPWRAALNLPGLLLAGVGTAIAVHVLVRGGSGWMTPLAAAAISLGLLAQPMGAVPFFGAFGLILIVARLLPLLAGWASAGRRSLPAASALLVLAVLLSPRVEALETMAQRWVIRDGQVHGTLEIAARGEANDRHLLLRPPAVLTAFEGEGWKVSKTTLADGSQAYILVATEAGWKTGRAGFRMPLPDPMAGWTLPTGPAASQRLLLRWNEPGWTFQSPQAALVEVPGDLAEGESGADMILAPADVVELAVRPRQRDATNEPTRFFAEVEDLFVPGQGVTNGFHAVLVRPAQGVVSSLVLEIPAGFTVGDVRDGPVGSWRFNPESRELRVAVEPAQSGPFTFRIESQKGGGALPQLLEISPVGVKEAAGVTGLLGLAFGEDAQPGPMDVQGMSLVNPDDFNPALLPQTSGNGSPVVLHRVYRLGGDKASISLSVVPVAPEVRVETRQVLSLGDDRMLLAVDLRALVTRAGIFKLTVEIPEGFDIESVTGVAPGHWTEGEESGKRWLQLHFPGRTLGERHFSIGLGASAPTPGSGWTVPRISVKEAARQTGTLIVVPERGLQVRATERERATQLDPKDAGMPQPGVLAFRLLQADWKLSLEIGRLDPWIAAQVLQEVTAREGQVLGRFRIAYRIENASIKSTRVRIPGLDEPAAATLRANGPAVGDFVPLGGEEWEIRFQRAIAGSTTVDIEYQRQGSSERLEILPLESPDFRQVSTFVAVRTSGRLETGEIDSPAGWQRSEWTSLPEILRSGAELSAPAAFFRVAEAEGPLGVTLKRHELAGTARVRVTGGTLTSLVSADGASVTSVDLDVRTGGKESLKVSLPDGASLFTVLVNGDGVPLVRDDGTWRFHVQPAAGSEGPASVRLVYGSRAGHGTVLEGPLLDVPLENLRWKVLLPPGWRLRDHEGDFDLQGGGSSPLTVESYREFAARQRAAGRTEAAALFDRANDWLQQGDQDKASEALGKVARAGLLDDASNEDARVQLRNLRTQQAALALNTRRQRMYFDNRAELPADNAGLEQAARDNPLFQGRTNFDPRDFDAYFLGNSADENEAMREIARRIVQQQLAADPAPPALDVTIAGRGQELNFVRSVQVNGERPMRIDLDLAKQSGSGWFFGGLVALLGAFAVTKRP